MNLLIICLVFYLRFSFTMGDLQVTLLQGSLRGKEQINEKGNVFYSYSGIPYAKPPVGDLRFKVNKNKSIILKHFNTKLKKLIKKSQFSGSINLFCKIKFLIFVHLKSWIM